MVPFMSLVCWFFSICVIFLRDMVFLLCWEDEDELFHELQIRCDFFFLSVKGLETMGLSIDSE